MAFPSWSEVSKHHIAVPARQIPLLLALICLSFLFLGAIATSQPHARFHSVDHTLYFDSSTDASTSSMTSSGLFLKPYLPLASITVALVFSIFFFY
ncbi:hypothetical protein GOP47_0027321 [Adiantum capillus-veneris]|nr:hypothetical protein GOP47_0027321 [Adiantum capillus-veneris]